MVTVCDRVPPSRHGEPPVVVTVCDLVPPSRPAGVGTESRPLWWPCVTVCRGPFRLAGAGTESRPLWWPCVTVCRRPGLQVPVSAVQSGLAGQHLQTILSSAAAQATFALPPDIASSMLQQQLNEALRQSAQQPQPRVVAVAPAAGGESGRGRDSNTRCSTRSPRHTHGTGGKRGSGWIG